MDVVLKSGNHDKNKDLLIDPSLVRGAYFGGSDDDEGNGVTTDASGNVYITGLQKSSNGISDFRSLSNI